MHTESLSHPSVRVGVFDRIANADRAVHALVDAGFPKEQITVICPSCSPGDYHEYKRRPPAGARTPVAASTGGAIGALLGGLVPLVGIVATGGVGVLAAGTLLAGAAGGAVSGGFIGAMLSRGFESEMTNFYDRALEKGQVLVGVECPGEGQEERLATAERILSRTAEETLPLTPG